MPRNYNRRIKIGELNNSEVFLKMIDRDMGNKNKKRYYRYVITNTKQSPNKNFMVFKNGLCVKYVNKEEVIPTIKEIEEMGFKLKTKQLIKIIGEIL